MEFAIDRIGCFALFKYFYAPLVINALAFSKEGGENISNRGFLIQ